MSATHAGCGGTILSGGSDATAHSYCDRCRAFQYDRDEDEEFPTGTNRKANQAAWDDGDERSPEAAFEAGDKVRAGDTEDDHDHGTVLAVAGDTITVGWSNGETVDHGANELEVDEGDCEMCEASRG